MTQVTTRRRSKFSAAIEQSLAYFGHATNAQLAEDLRRNYPHISDTTVHRITQRLIVDGKAGVAGYADDGAVVIDSNPDPHDHLVCEHCRKYNDIIVSDNCRQSIQNSIRDCELTGSLTIIGLCSECR